MTDASQPWDGVPLHPERGGWHWLLNTNGVGDPFPMLWDAGGQMWDAGDAGWRLAEDIAIRWTYLGPCLTPTESAALADAAAAEMKEIAAAHFERQIARIQEMLKDRGFAHIEAECRARIDALRRVVTSIRALPLAAPSLDAIRAEERRKGMEEMARVVSSAADEYGGCEEGEFYIVSKINAAVAERIEAMSGMFTGFTALPAPEDWRQVLFIAPFERLTIEDAERAYRAMARGAHPDHPGGSHDAMARLNRAIEAARKELGNA
jgi:hypothetical protein